MEALRARRIELKRDLGLGWRTPRPRDAKDLSLWELWEHALLLGGIRAQHTQPSLLPLEGVNLALQGTPGWI